MKQIGRIESCFIKAGSTWFH